MPTNPASRPWHTHRRARRLNRRTGLAATLLLAGALMLAWGGLLGGAVQTSAGAAPPAAVNQCNGTGEGGGRAVECHVLIVNNLDMATGLSSSSVTLTVCDGFANAPQTLVCIGPTTTVNATQLTTAVAQCNGSALGGGATVLCSVDVTNNVTGIASTSAATVDQCIGSGAGGIAPTTLCDPVESTTTADVTQCNGSANGGGGTMRVRCTVAPSTETTALPITINQCNDSAAGGSTVTCTSSIVNLITAPPVTSPPVTSPPVTSPPVTSPPVTSPPVTSPPVTSPPGISPSVTSVPVSSPPVLTPPVLTPPVLTPPVLTPPVLTPPVLTPPVSSPPFVPPPGLTGDTRPSHGNGRSAGLLGAGAAALAGGVVLLVPRRRRR